MKLGDIKLNGKYYKILSDPNNYRVSSMTDFAPRASTPGGSATHSELGAYQPYLQTDWRHGFGFNWYEDEMGYMRTDGNVDTRHEGIAMLFTNSVSSDTDNHVKEGFVNWHNSLWSYGDYGLRKYSSGAWSQIDGGADTAAVTIQPAYRDEYIQDTTPTTTYGNNEHLIVGETNAGAIVRRSLIKFDLTSIPTNATVTAATLSLYMDAEESSNDRSLYVYRMLTGWYGSTWNTKYSSVAWEKAGASGATDREATSIGKLDLTAAEATGWKDIALSVTDITDLINGTLTNNGFMLQMATESNDSYQFKSSETTSGTTYKPKLTITYTTPTTPAKVNYALAAGKYLFYCPDGKRIRKIDAADTDSYTGNDSSSIDYSWLIIYNGYVYAGKDSSNWIHRDSTDDLSDLEGTSNDPNIIYVGPKGGHWTKGAVVYGGYLYVSTLDGLWKIGDDLVANRILDFTSEASADNFRSMAVHNGYLLFPIRDKIYQWNGARMSDVTPPRITDTFPYTTYGRFDNFTSVGRFMYCTARTNEATYKEDLLCFDGTSWTKLMRLVSNGADTITAMGYDSTNNRLWYHLDNATADATYYIPMQLRSELPYAAFPTSGTHSLILSRWHMGYEWVVKSTPSVVIEASGCTSTVYLSVYYSIDGGSWVKWGDIKTNGAIELTDPVAAGTVEFNHISIRIDFITGTASSSPILEGVTLRYIMRPNELDGWMLNIPLAQNVLMGVTEEGRTSAQIVADLKTAKASKAPIEFIDLDGTTYSVYVTAYNRRLLVLDSEESGGTPKLEYVATINLLEVG